MVTNLNIPAWEKCPRFSKCQINKCILHPDYNKLENFACDPAIRDKQKCIPKVIRKRIALAFGLKHGGLTSRERKSAEMWASLPEKEKQRRIDILKKNSPLTRCLSKGLVVTPRKQRRAVNPRANGLKTQGNDAMWDNSEKLGVEE